MLTLMPAPMSRRIAGSPGPVAGTLIITLSRPTACQSRFASATVPSVFIAR
jgi:hypothetical protein